MDEVDSILIDEARTPLMISGEPEQAAETYGPFARAVQNLEPGEDYEVDEKMHTAVAHRGGRVQGREDARVDNLVAVENGELVNDLIQAIKAKELYNRDDEYVVMDGEVQDRGRVHRPQDGGPALVGGAAPGGRGEGGRAASRTRTLTVATVTIQNYFRMYEKLSGMTGTAATEAVEFRRSTASRWCRVPTTGR